MSNFTWAGFWDNGTAYQTNTFVTYENVVYVSLSPNISSTPSSGNTDWDIVVYGQGSTYIERTPLPTVTPTPTDTPSVTPTSTETPTPTPTITNTQTPSHTPVGTQTPTPTVTETPTNTPTNTETPTNTPTPSTTPIPVTGYGYNLVAIPYGFPESGNSIMNNPGDNTSGSTEINLLSTTGRGFYFNSIDSSSVDRTNYYSGFTGQSITITFSQTGNTAIYSGDTDSLKYWDTPLGTGFVFGTGIGVPPNNIPSGTAVLIQSATTQFTIGLPVYISIEINGNVTPTPTETQTPTPTETPTPEPTSTSTETPTPEPTSTSTETPTPEPTPTNTPTPTETSSPTPTPSTTPIPVTGYGYNLVAIPYGFPESGNSIMNNPGDNTSGSTEINLLSTTGRGFYFNSIDSSSVDRTNYYSGFTGQSITITFSQTGNTAIYSGDTDSLKYWDTPLGTGFVFGTGIGVPPNNIPSGTAVLIQSATTQFTIGLPVYISIEINGNVTPTPTPTETPTPTNTETPTNTTTNTETPTETPTPTNTETPTNTPTPTSTEPFFILIQNGDILTAQDGSGIEYQH